MDLINILLLVTAIIAIIFVRLVFMRRPKRDYTTQARSNMEHAHQSIRMLRRGFNQEIKEKLKDQFANNRDIINIGIVEHPNSFNLHYSHEVKIYKNDPRELGDRECSTFCRVNFDTSVITHFEEEAFAIGASKTELVALKKLQVLCDVCDRANHEGRWKSSHDVKQNSTTVNVILSSEGMPEIKFL